MPVGMGDRKVKRLNGKKSLAGRWQKRQNNRRSGQSSG